MTAWLRHAWENQFKASELTLALAKPARLSWYAIGFVILSCVCGPAQAAYELCNETSYVLRASVVQQGEREYQSNGWFTVYPGFCRTAVSGSLKHNLFYVHARTIAGHKAPTHQWAGEHRFCVDTADFSIPGDANCERRGFQTAYFSRVQVHGKKSWTSTFTEPSNHSVKKAQILGVQRLLADLGLLTQKQMDGYWGRGTERAISRFARKHSIKVPSDPSPELFSALENAVNNQASEQGIELCNSTEDAIWAAIGLPNKKGASTTKGWFELQPAQCVRATSESLKNYSNIFIYGETVDSAEIKTYWRGNTRLCTNDVMFSITTPTETCEDQGYLLMGFESISTGGDISFTHTFRKDQSAEDTSL